MDNVMVDTYILFVLYSISYYIYVMFYLIDLSLFKWDVTSCMSNL